MPMEYQPIPNLLPIQMNSTKTRSGITEVKEDKKPEVIETPDSTFIYLHTTHLEKLRKELAPKGQSKGVNYLA